MIEGEERSGQEAPEGCAIPGANRRRTTVRRPWIQLQNFRQAHVLLLLPCNAAACVGNYFRADVYRETGWNTWREADALLRDLREGGRVAFAAVDSSILETRPDDPRGAVVLETEMQRVRNPDGEDWGAPAWRWFRPSPSGRWSRLEALTESLVKGIRRFESLGIPRVLALVNPRAYFLALAAAVQECGLLDRWVLFRPPAHPRYLVRAVRLVVPFVRAAATGQALPGGIYPIPEFYPHLLRERRRYRQSLPPPWRHHDRLPSFRAVTEHWAMLIRRRRTRSGLLWRGPPETRQPVELRDYP